MDSSISRTNVSIQERSFSPARWRENDEGKVSPEMQQKEEEAAKLKGEYVAQIGREIAKIVVHEHFPVKDLADAQEKAKTRPHLLVLKHGEELRGFDRDEINKNHLEKTINKKINALNKEQTACFVYLNGVAAQLLLQAHTWKVADTLCYIEQIEHSFSGPIQYKTYAEIPFLKSPLLRSSVYRTMQKVEKEHPETLRSGTHFWNIK